MTHGVVYLQDLGDNVYALALATGKLKWEYKVSPEDTRAAGRTASRSPAVSCTGTP